VESLSVFNNELIAGGWFITAGGQLANNIARWNDSAWAPLGTGTNDGVSAVAVYDNQLIPGGYFTIAGGQPSAYFARWGRACPGDLDCDLDRDLQDLAILLADFGCADGSCVGDVDGDGDVDLQDLANLLANFGATCP
jgi:hypothetical protein